MIEIIPKPSTPTQKFFWQDILSYISIILLLITILSYFTIFYFLKNSEKTLKNLEEKLAREKTTEERSLEKEVLSWQKKIGDFGKLINEHISISNFFQFLEKNTHPKVFFSKIDLNPPKSEVILFGQTEDFSILQQQISIFKLKKEIKDLNLSNIAIGKEGKVEFILNLSLDPAIFKYFK